MCMQLYVRQLESDLQWLTFIIANICNYSGTCRDKKPKMQKCIFGFNSINLTLCTILKIF